MRRLPGIVMLLSVNAQAAEHDWPMTPRAKEEEPRVSFSLSSRAGLVKTPFVTAAFPEASGFGVLLTGDAAVRVSAGDWLRFRLPLSITRVDFPARAQVPETALGNVELGLEHPLQLRPSTRVGLLAAFIAPTAQHGPENSLLQNRALTLGNALNGGKDSALLTPGVTGLRVAVSIEQQWRPFELRASLSVPVLMRVSDASLPPETKTHWFGLQPTIELEGAWWMTSSLGASLGAGLVAHARRVEEPALERDRARRLQPFLEPSLHAQLGKHVALALDGSIPVGGSLGGDAWSVGLRGKFAF